eukprot:499605-Rhodomonas_salina.6
MGPAAHRRLSTAAYAIAVPHAAYALGGCAYLSQYHTSLWVGRAYAITVPCQTRSTLCQYSGALCRYRTASRTPRN